MKTLKTKRVHDLQLWEGESLFSFQYISVKTFRNKLFQHSRESRFIKSKHIYKFSLVVLSRKWNSCWRMSTDRTQPGFSQTCTAVSTTRIYNFVLLLYLEYLQNTIMYQEHMS